ncbi:hypothetical protein ACPOLB_22465 [Rubrivivax sp. RP6-9]|uniref:hypothetical protein n=1 Tax=Rubrivivax sp. RP6-9 TaxID=3415750 RepID=UPI003CC69EDB
MHTFQRLIPAATLALLLAACGGGGSDTPSTTGGTAGASGSKGTGSPGSGSAPVQATLPPLVIPSGQESVTCRDASIGALSLDTVVVPDGAACELFGTRLVGSIKSGALSTVVAVDVAVNGDLQADGSALVVVEGASSFGGSVQIKQGGAATVLDASITGDLQLDAMAGSLLADGNRIGGSLQAVGNRGGLALFDNTMDGNLQCKENQPAPTGSGNVAASKEDQCAGL